MTGHSWAQAIAAGLNLLTICILAAAIIRISKNR